MKRQITFTIIFWVLFVLVNSIGCATYKKSAKGGTGTITKTNVTFNAPENPSTPSAQTVDTSLSDGIAIPEGSVVTSRDIYPDHTNETKIELSKDSYFGKQELHNVKQSFGATHKDNTNEVIAKYKAHLPILFFGLFCLLATAAFAYFGWWTKAGISLAMGVACCVLYSALPQYGIWIVAALGIIGVISILLVRASYFKGATDGKEQTK